MAEVAIEDVLGPDMLTTCPYCPSEEACNEKQPGPFGLWCTREPGHEGEHVACGSRHGQRRWSRVATD